MAINLTHGGLMGLDSIARMSRGLAAERMRKANAQPEPEPRLEAITLHVWHDTVDGERLTLCWLRLTDEHKKLAQPRAEWNADSVNACENCKHILGQMSDEVRPHAFAE